MRQQAYSYLGDTQDILVEVLCFRRMYENVGMQPGTQGMMGDPSVMPIMQSVGDKERTKFLFQFQGCFSESLLGELLPERLEDHAIRVIPGSSPPNKLPYRVFKAQQEEIMSQEEIM